MRIFSSLLICSIAPLLMAEFAPCQGRGSPEQGKVVYQKRCTWCHGPEGDGEGPSARGMFPRPRNFTDPQFKIRSTPAGRLPTDEDLVRVISRGLPGTPMPAWQGILSEEEILDVVAYVKTFSKRFQSETPEVLDVPSGPASIERGEELFQATRCFMCHGPAGRSDGGITTALNFEWGIPHTARDFTRGWTFKGGHEPADIYLRITGGLNGTPMGPYAELLSDQERWDLAHYVSTLDTEPDQTSDDFVVLATLIEGELPDSPDAPQWAQAARARIPLGGQVTLDPPLRWWIPTSGTIFVSGLWNRRELAYLLQWDDPTGPEEGFDPEQTVRAPDAALIQFAIQDAATKPYFLFGDADNPVDVWRWWAGDGKEELHARGNESIDPRAAQFEVSSSWSEGRWRVQFSRSLRGEPDFAPGKFVPTLFSVYDGANAESGNVRALSTWLYTTLEPPRSIRPALMAGAWLLGVALFQMWIIERLRRKA